MTQATATTPTNETVIDRYIGIYDRMRTSPRP